MQTIRQSGQRLGDRLGRCDGELTPSHQVLYRTPPSPPLAIRSVGFFIARNATHDRAVADGGA
jgi:hypothetical protein